MDFSGAANLLRVARSPGLPWLMDAFPSSLPLFSEEVLPM